MRLVRQTLRRKLLMCVLNNMLYQISSSTFFFVQTRVVKSGQRECNGLCQQCQKCMLAQHAFLMALSRHHNRHHWTARSSDFVFPEEGTLPPAKTVWPKTKYPRYSVRVRLCASASEGCHAIRSRGCRMLTLPPRKSSIARNVPACEEAPLRQAQSATCTGGRRRVCGHVRRRDSRALLAASDGDARSFAGLL